MACEGCEVAIRSFHCTIDADTDSLIDFCIKHGLILAERNCDLCGEAIVVRWEDDKPIFRCGKKNFQGRRCPFSVTGSKGTWFDKLNFGMSKVVGFTIYWCVLNTPRQDLIITELKLTSDTVVKWSGFCREVCEHWAFMNQKDEIGGTDIVVEIDEIKFEKKKYNKEHDVECPWLFAGIEKDNHENFFLVPVPRCDKETLLDVILGRIAPGTKILSDCWKSYDCLQDRRYQLLGKNNSMEFLPVFSGAVHKAGRSSMEECAAEEHTPNTEKKPRGGRRAFPNLGRNTDQHLGYIAEFLFKKANPLETRVHAFMVEISKVYPPKSLLTEYKYHHTNDKPYQCADCPRMFRTKNLLWQHSIRMHEEFSSSQGRTNMCNVCNEPFESLESLHAHRSQHSEEEIAAAKAKKDSVLHKCEVCGKILQSKFTLQNHMMLHSAVIRCDQCGKMFVSKRSLDVHYRLHTGERPFICNYCGEGFITKSILVIHERIHTGELPYECDICGKAFRSNTSLIPHKKIHSEIRPFGCDTCDRRFKRKDALEAHIRIHTGERPYICQLCGRGFRQRTDCKKHERSHYNLPCPYCKKFFKSATSLSVHIKSVHNMEQTVEPHSEETDIIVESTESIISEDIKPIILETVEFVTLESVEVVTEGEEPLTVLDTTF